MAAFRRLGFVLRMLGSHPQPVTGGLYGCAKFG